MERYSKLIIISDNKLLTYILTDLLSRNDDFINYQSEVSNTNQPEIWNMNTTTIHILLSSE